MSKNKQPKTLKPTDNELKVMWYDAGGSFHGPNIETGSMPESKLIPFLRKLIKTK